MRSYSNGLVDQELTPGSYVALYADTNADEVAQAGRRAGLELRDSLLVLRPGPRTGFIFLFRKPLTEGTVAAQVIATGTGGLNIDACRVETDENTIRHNNGGTGNVEQWRTGKRASVTGSTLGRWPSNIVLVHGPDCRNLGTKKVGASSGVSKSAPITAVRHSGAHSAAGGHQSVGRIQPVFGYGDDDGQETIAAWACEPGCSIPFLDADEISPSRFYPQFSSETELFTWLGLL